MSFSKHIKHYRLLVHNQKRSISADGTKSIDETKMHQASSKFLLLNNPKIITNHLKYYLTKITQNELVDHVINKEFTKTCVKYITKHTSSLAMEDTQAKPSQQQKESLLGSLRIKISANTKEMSKPKWIKPTMAKGEISNKIRMLLTSISSDISKQEHINEFCEYITKYPEARHIAVREGSIKTLLRLRQTTRNESTKGAMNEALSLLGYSDSFRGNGLRILSIDGGGTRGLLVIQMMKKLEEIAGKRIVDMFDMICGVSTGAIIASLLVVKRKSLDEIEEIYQRLGTKVFTQHPIKGTSSLVWSHSYYDTNLWEDMLKTEMGEQVLISTQRQANTPKLLVVSAVVNQSRLSAYAFRNYNLPCKVQSQYIGSSNYKVWEAVRASAAAPTYFEEFRLGNTLHQDGGILVNNPTAVAIHEARLLWPRTPLQCVISFGTGRTAPNPATCDAEIVSSSWKSKFLAVIDSATDTEGVHSMLSDLLPHKTYYRFNPYLTEMLGISEISPEKMAQLRRDALMYLRRNEDKFSEAADSLNIRKSTMQKVQDYLNLQLEINGVLPLSKY